jgi:hypothetical protein
MVDAWNKRYPKIGDTSKSGNGREDKNKSTPSAETRRSMFNGLERLVDVYNEQWEQGDAEFPESWKRMFSVDPWGNVIMDPAIKIRWCWCSFEVCGSQAKGQRPGVWGALMVCEAVRHTTCHWHGRRSHSCLVLSIVSTASFCCR